MSRPAPHKNRVVLMLFGLCLLALSAQAQQAEKVEVRVVYHLDGSRQAGSSIRQIRNHRASMPDAKIVVVALAGGVDFLLRDAADSKGNPFEPMVDDLSLTGVEFRVCNNTLRGRNIERDALHSEAKIVDSGVAEISRLQSLEGYAYIKP